MNFSSFLEEYRRLIVTTPKNPTNSHGGENTDWAAYAYRCADSYYCFDAVELKNCYYCYDCVRCVDCVDCDYCVDCELLYDSVDCFRTFNSNFMNYSARTYDSFFCWDCDDSHDLFGCAHLSHKQYCIFNRQYTKTEYEAKVKELIKLPVAENYKKLNQLINEYPFGPTNITNSENSLYGNHVHYCSNCYLCFDAAHNENCGYLYNSDFCKDSYDLDHCFKAEMCYECSDTVRSFNCDCLLSCSDCYDCAYLSDCVDCHNCFGCVGIAHKKFCILNRQYPKEQYEAIVAGLKQSVR